MECELPFTTRGACEHRLLHELDVDLLVAEWEKAGFYLPFNVNNAASLVLARMRDQTSKGFMLKKTTK